VVSDFAGLAKDSILPVEYFGCRFNFMGRERLSESMPGTDQLNSIRCDRCIEALPGGALASYPQGLFAIFRRF